MKFSKQLIACAVAAGLAAPMSAFATNGYFAHGYGIKSKALAGGGSALPQDAMIAADNPAGMVWVGERMDLGLTLFSPSKRGYTVTGAPSGAAGTFGIETGSFESDNDFFLIPNFAYNWMLNDVSSLGLTVYGNGGMNTEYNVGQYTWIGPTGLAGTYYGGTTGVDLSQLFINASYSRKINDKNSFGVGLIAAYQRFNAEGLVAFSPFSSDPSNLTNRGYDTSLGFGAKIGWQGTVSPGLTLAASYQTEISMDEFSNYQGLFAENGDFDIPSTWTIGLAWDITKSGTLTFDVQQIMYSDIKAIANPLQPNMMNCGMGDPSYCLGASNGAGFGWEDMTIYKLGYQWSTSPEWTWRVGASMGDQPIPDSETMFNIIAPAVMETHLTGGFTYNMSKNSDFSMAAMYAPKSTVTGPSGMDPAQTIELEMTQWELSANWGWKF